MNQATSLMLKPKNAFLPPCLAVAAAVLTGACSGGYQERAVPAAPVLSAPAARPPATPPKPEPLRADRPSASAPAAPAQPPAPPRPSSGAPYYYSSVAVSEPVVALTFDDGPHPVLTPRLLDILKENDVKATFFVIGRNVKAFPAIAARIVAEGHEIANHSWSHPNLSGMSDAAVLDQLARANQAIKEATGVEARTFRPPYGAFSVRQRVMAYEKLGMPSILWSVDPLDWKIRSAPSVRAKLVAGAHPGGILLAHDIHPTTIEAVPGVLAGLKARGFRFVTVSRLLEMAAPDFAAAGEDAR